MENTENTVNHVDLEQNPRGKNDSQSISNKLSETTWENYAIGALSVGQYLTRAVSDVYYGKHVYDILKSIGTAVLFNKTMEKFEDLLKPLKSQEVALKDNLDKFGKLGNGNKNNSINNSTSCDIGNGFNTSYSNIGKSEIQNMKIGNKTISIPKQTDIACINRTSAAELGIISKKDSERYDFINGLLCFTHEKEVQVFNPDSWIFKNNSESLNKTEEIFSKFQEVQNQKKEFLEKNFKSEKEFSGFIDNMSKQCMESKEVITNLTQEVNDFFNSIKSVQDDINNSTKKLEDIQNKQKDTVGKTSETREKNAPIVNDVLYYSTAINIMLMASIYTLNQHKIKKALPNEVKEQYSFAKDIGKGLVTGAGLTALNHVSHILAKAILDYGFHYMTSESEKSLGVNSDNENYKMAQDTFSTIILPLVVYNCTMKYGLPLCAEAYKFFAGPNFSESEEIKNKVGQEEYSELQKTIKSSVDDKIHDHNTLTGVKNSAKTAKSLWNSIVCCPRRKNNHVKLTEEFKAIELQSVPSDTVKITESGNLVNNKKDKGCVVF
jgi:hypothetical protein